VYFFEMEMLVKQVLRVVLECQIVEHDDDDELGLDHE
jgi:hypothetical protein